jgi:ABC-type cobalamin transport system permease subunit
MDGVGIAIIGISIIVYLVAIKFHKRSLQTMAATGIGFGLGIVVAAVLAYTIVMGAFHQAGF